MLHEFMHVKRFGHRYMINDMNATLSHSGGEEVSVYGASRCEEYAQMGDPNLNTARNGTLAVTYPCLGGLC